MTTQPESHHASASVLIPVALQTTGKNLEAIEEFRKAAVLYFSNPTQAMLKLAARHGVKIHGMYADAPLGYTIRPTSAPKP